MEEKAKGAVKIGGVVAIILGTGALVYTGVGEDVAISLVAGVFVLGGVIAAIFAK